MSTKINIDVVETEIQSLMKTHSVDRASAKFTIYAYLSSSPNEYDFEENQYELIMEYLSPRTVIH